MKRRLFTSTRKSIGSILLSVIVATCILAAVCEAGNTNPLYGFTADGIFYIHRDLIAAAGGSEPRLVAGVNDWRRVPMESHGKYYIYRAQTTGQFRFPLYYCFDIGNERYIPHVFVDKGSSLVNPNEVAPNSSGGYNFYTKPQDSLPE